MRYSAVVEYDGTGYYGFQRQREKPTIQQELEQSINLVTGASIPIAFAGRTDSGVHALGQVIAFDVDWAHETDDLHRAINANLPDAIVLRKLREARPDFHPRFDARKRVYEYTIYNSPVRSPYRRHYSWHVRRRLDLQSMNSAADSIIGVHDFSTFGTPPQGTNPVRKVFSSEWRVEDDLLVFRIEANAFLKRMVRSLVGTLEQVGAGYWSEADFVDAFWARDRDRAGQTAPARGLFLMSVQYDADELGE
ncbi:MAG: tRNA pseudouridine(38-40) synthase TruA [Candidatus Promineifilaceae bacterium]|jgi:tRNA pseudouridine38-40 synthase